MKKININIIQNLTTIIIIHSIIIFIHVFSKTDFNYENLFKS